MSRTSRRAPGSCLLILILAGCNGSPGPAGGDLRDGPPQVSREAAPPPLPDGRPPGDGTTRDRSRDTSPAPSCPATNLAAGDHTITLTFGGLQRDFDLHVPASLKSGVPAPLVVDFHGFMSDKFQQRLVSGTLAESDKQGFAVAYPNGWGAQRSWNAGAFCCGEAVQQKLDDVGLAKEIVQNVASSVCIDRKRVYATGISNGGMLSHRLACEASSVFAAVAPVAGRIDLQPITSCQPPRPVAVIAFHGLTDPLVPYADATASIARWVQVDGCSDAGTVTFTKGKSSCKTNATCQAGVKVALCSLDAGHITYFNADQVAIAPLAWDFFKDFSLP